MSKLTELNREQLISLLAGFISMLIYGSAYTYGTLVPYLTSYIYYQADKDITPNKMALLLPISIIVLNLGMPICNIPQLQFSNRLTTLISIVGICLSVLSMSFCNQFWHFLVLYGIVFGLFIGYGYMAPIKNCYQHIPELKGLCSGVCILGFGISSLLFNFILLSLINPHNEQAQKLDDGRKVYSRQLAENVPFALKIMAGIYLGIGLIGIWLMRPPVEKVNPLLTLEPQQSERESVLSKNTIGNNVMSSIEPSQGLVKLLIKSNIHLLTLTLTTSVPFGIFIAFNYKEYGMISIGDDQFLTIVGSLGAVFNGFGRLIFGMLLDKFSYRVLSMVINGVLAIFAFTFSLIGQTKWLFLIAVALTYFAYGGNYSIYPTHTVRILGNEIGSKIYCLVFIGFSVGCALQWLARLFLVPVDDQFNGFRTCFFIFGGMNLIAILLSFFVPYHYVQQQKPVQTSK